MNERQEGRRKEQLMESDNLADEDDVCITLNPLLADTMRIPLKPTSCRHLPEHACALARSGLPPLTRCADDVTRRWLQEGTLAENRHLHQRQC